MTKKIIFPAGTDIDFLFDVLKKITKEPVAPNSSNYHDEVFAYLEYIGYPDYVLQYDPESIAKSVSASIHNFWSYGVSPRMAAISIFGLTMEFQVMCGVKDSTKH